MSTKSRVGSSLKQLLCEQYTTFSLENNTAFTGEESCLMADLLTQTVNYLERVLTNCEQSWKESLKWQGESIVHFLSQQSISALQAGKEVQSVPDSLKIELGKALRALGSDRWLAGTPSNSSKGVVFFFLYTLFSHISTSMSIFFARLAFHFWGKGTRVQSLFFKFTFSSCWCDWLRSCSLTSFLAWSCQLPTI